MGKVVKLWPQRKQDPLIVVAIIQLSSNQSLRAGASIHFSDWGGGGVGQK